MSLNHVLQNIQQATHLSPVNFTATFLSANTLTIALAPFVVSDANCHVVFVQVLPAGGTWSAPMFNGVNGISFTAAANVITATGMPTQFAAGDTYWVGLAQRPPSGGGGAASGGDALYTSPQDFTVAFGPAANQVTLTGLPFTPEIEQFASLTYVDATGLSHTCTPDVNAFNYDSVTGILTVTNGTFAVGDLGYKILLLGPDKSYTQLTNSKRVQEINPLSAQSIWESLCSTAVHAVSAATYYPSANGMSLLGFRNLTLQLQAGVNATLTIEGTASTEAAPTWLDITRTAYDLATNATGVANWNNANALVDYEELGIALIRVKVVVVTAPTPVYIYVRRTAI